MKIASRDPWFPVTWLLAVWMTVISFGVSLSHVHAAGGIRHVEGLGCNLTACPLRSPESPGGTAEFHRHLVLFGLELPSEAANDPSTPRGSNLTSVVGSACDSPLPDALDCFADCSVNVPVPTPFATEQTRTGLGKPLPFTELSAYARRARTGVLRT